MYLRIILTFLLISISLELVAVECPVNIEGAGGVDTTSIPDYPTLGTYTEYKAIQASCYCMGTNTVVSDTLQPTLDVINTNCSQFYANNSLPAYTGLFLISSSSTSILYEPQPENNITESGTLTCEVLINPYAPDKLERGAYKQDTLIYYVQSIGDGCPANTTYEQTFQFNYDTDKTCLVNNIKDCQTDYYYDGTYCQPSNSSFCPNYLCPDGFKLRDIVPQSGGQTYTTCERPPLKNCTNGEPYLQTDVCPEDQVCTDQASCDAYARVNNPCPYPDTQTFVFNYVNPFEFSRTCTDNTDGGGSTDSGTDNISNNATNIVQAINSSKEEVKDRLTSVGNGIQNKLDTQTTIINDTRTLAQQMANDLSEIRNNQASGDIQSTQLQVQVATASTLNEIKQLLSNNGSTDGSGNGSTTDVDLSGVESRIDSTNTKLDDIKDLLTTDTVQANPTEFPDSESDLNTKKQEFSDYLNTQSDRVSALFNVNNIAFSGSLPEMSFQVLNNSFTIDTTWIDYILAFLGVLVVLWAYYDALIIVLGG